MLLNPKLLDVDLAIEKLGALARPVAECEDVPLAEAVGRVLAEDVVAPIDLPPFDASAMDGYALNVAGLEREGAKRLRVVGRSAAGLPANASVGQGEAVRIFTGAVLPVGADAVLLQEDAQRQGAWVETTAPIEPGQHVRKRGHDVAAGAVLCSAGHKLGVYDLAWMAACGIAELRARRRVRVAVVSTGDELALPGQPLKPGQIYESNRFALDCLLRQRGAVVADYGCVADDLDAIRDALRKAAAAADVVVASGGVSVGDADFVKSAVEDVGSIEFWRVALKPGKPLAVGRIGGALFFGLPGNPVSTIITYLLFVSPAIDLLEGAKAKPPLTLPAVLGDSVRHSKGRREYMRGTMRERDGALVVRITGDQGSNRLATFANANCLVVIERDAGSLRPGDAVRVIPLPSVPAHPMQVPEQVQE